MTPRTRAGLVKFRPVSPGSRIALVAPASPFDRGELDRGVTALRQMGFDPVYDDSLFDRGPIVAGAASRRAEALMRAMSRSDVDAVIAVRGGYGSAEVLPFLDLAAIVSSRTAFVGYSDLTSVHAVLNGLARLASVHGPMIDGRIARGDAEYDRASFVASLGATPIGELRTDALETLKQGEASGPLFGGTLTQIASSMGTPYAFEAPAGSVLFLEDVGERPYRLRRTLTQLRLGGRFARVSAIVFGQMPGCDEPGGLADAPTARSVIADFLADFGGPVLFGFPSGHASAPLISLPFGVHARVVGSARPALVLEESAAA